jgi:HK97 gp10 family phage protein
MQITFTGVDSLNKDLKNELKKFVKQIADDIYVTAKKNTPVRSGRARKNWTESTTVNNFAVENKVPYIGKLEAGASRQAPKGIIGPTLTAIKGKYK